MKKKQSDKWSVQISKELAEKVKQYCEKKGYTMAHVIEKGVNYCLDNEDLTLLEYKSQNRFLCTFLSDSSYEPDLPPSFLIKRVDRPRFAIDATSKKYKIVWWPIKMCLFDTVAPNVSKIIQDITLNHKIFDLEIKTLDASGNTIEKWLIKNGHISSADFGSVNWEINKPSEIFLDIDYEYAKLILD